MKKSYVTGVLSGAIGAAVIAGAVEFARASQPPLVAHGVWGGSIALTPEQQGQLSALLGQPVSFISVKNLAPDTQEQFGATQLCICTNQSMCG